MLKGCLADSNLSLNKYSLDISCVVGLILTIKDIDFKLISSLSLQAIKDFLRANKKSTLHSTITFYPFFLYNTVFPY
jgi:hypothetical protein